MLTNLWQRISIIIEVSDILSQTSLPSLESGPSTIRHPLFINIEIKVAFWRKPSTTATIFKMFQ